MWSPVISVCHGYWLRLLNQQSILPWYKKCFFFAYFVKIKNYIPRPTMLNKDYVFIAPISDFSYLLRMWLNGIHLVRAASRLYLNVTAIRNLSTSVDPEVVLRGPSGSFGVFRCPLVSFDDPCVVLWCHTYTVIVMDFLSLEPDTIEF